MSPQERLELIEAIWNSLLPVEQLAIPESHRIELDRRLADADQNPSVGSPWDDVETRIRGGR